MKFRILTILILVTTFLSNGKAQRPVYIEGHVTATETGLPVPQKELTFWETNGMVLATAYTNQSGYYIAQMNITTSDSSSFVYASVTDCSQSVQVQEILINTQAYYTADFEICTLNNNCQASFFYQPNPGNQLMINFENQSFPATNTCIWTWDFSDGVVSNEFSPDHEFADPGIYIVCLLMTDTAINCTSNFCLEVWVGNISPDCQAMFSWIPEGLTVSFSDLSTGFPDNYFWDFGDGTSSGEQNPVHSWNASGTFQVCLTIFNDSTQCQDTFCDYITIGDTLPVCHADYTYEQTEELTIAFTNLSTGLPDLVTWDFGDGTPFSHEYDATHTWAQPGIYHVCLAITSNYTSCSDVLCMYITVGDTISACQAAFTALVDSIPGNINHYWFVDESTGFNISSWYWDFGDGTISFVQHPEHTFAESGTYNVCLTASGQGNGGYCSNTICQTIATPAYSNLGGQVFAGNFPINNPTFTGDTAAVRLFRKTGNHLSEVASGFFFEFGYYYFLSVMEGEYVVQAGLTPGSVDYPSYLPAYTGETQHWQQSQEISLFTGDVFDANVIMPELTQINTGPGIINGSIFCIDNSVVDFRNRIIFLSQSGNIVSYTGTGGNGDFSFRDLPIGSYSISAEIAGIYSQSRNIILIENVIQALDIQLQVSISPIVGIEEKPLDEFSEVKLYPNPASENLTMEFMLNDPLRLVSEVYTSSGVICKKSQHSCISGENNLNFNISDLKPGIYLILLESEDGQILSTVKFAKR